MKCIFFFFWASEKDEHSGRQGLRGLFFFFFSFLFFSLFSRERETKCRISLQCMSGCVYMVII